MNNKFFNITPNNFPDSIYNAVGQITMNAQNWEEEFKTLAKKLNIRINKVEKLSLNKLNDALKKNNIISSYHYEALKDVINIRNYINHKFFLIDFNNTTKGFDDNINTLCERLNSAQFLIFEARDIISNLIDKLDGINCMRPTIFD